jgi:hypothetical protein
MMRWTLIWLFLPRSRRYMRGPVRRRPLATPLKSFRFERCTCLTRLSGRGSGFARIATARRGEVVDQNRVNRSMARGERC